NDGKIVRVGENKRLGKFVELQDTYGNTYTYARLKKVSKSYPAPRLRTTTQKQVAKELALPAKDAAPTAPASSTTKKATRRERAAKKANTREARGKTAAKPAPAAPATTKQRLFANPQRPNAGRAGGEQHELQELLLEGLRPQPQGRPHQAPAPGLARRRRHDPRPHRQDLEHAGAA